MLVERSWIAASGSSFLWMRWLNCGTDDRVESCVCAMTRIVGGLRVIGVVLVSLLDMIVKRYVVIILYWFRYFSVVLCVVVGVLEIHFSYF